MKNKIINLLLLVSLVVIALLVFNQQQDKNYDQQDIAEISEVMEKRFDSSRNKKPTKPQSINNKQATNANPHPNMGKMNQKSTSGQAIIGVIYKRANATWFFKAKDSVENINTISASFKSYFIGQLKFDQQEQPIFSHIPESMKAKNTSSMRVATFKIGDVEVSVSQLSGSQDVYANVRRWMKQIGLTDNSKINLNFSEDKKVITVKMSG